MSFCSIWATMPAPSCAKRVPISASCRVQHGSRHAPGFARGLVAAGQRQWAQLADAFESCVLYAQQFTAPGHAIGAEPDAIERQPEHRPALPVFRANGRDVRMVVLHRDRGQAVARGEGQRGTRAVVVGVQVVRDDGGLDVDQVEHAFDRFVEKVAGRGIVQVADMR